MRVDPWLLALLFSLGFAAYALLTALWNLSALEDLLSAPTLEAYPSVSVLVPARNEEENLPGCLDSLLLQDYPNYEIIVLDDNSEDGTWDLIRDYSARFEKVKGLKGEPLPEGWHGKHWACHQLAREARGDLLLFVDADTRLSSPEALRKAVSALLYHGADMLTGIPKEEALTFGELLIIPVIPWSLSSLLPVKLAHRSRRPEFSAGIGQFMLFRREAYEGVGGHEAVRQVATDDMALAFLIKAHGYRWRFLDLSRGVRCRMYEGFRKALRGLTRQVFPALGYSWLAVGSVAVITGVWLFAPLATLGLAFMNWAVPALYFKLALASLGLSWASWSLEMIRWGYPPLTHLLFPISLTLTWLSVLRSAYAYATGRAAWKGRALEVPKETKP